MEMMLGRGEDIEAGIVGEHRELAQFVEHLLVALGVAADRPQLLALLEGGRDRRQHEKHELHGGSSRFTPASRGFGFC